MLQAFVPATSDADKDGGTKKRRRPAAAGEGEAASSIYESIVRPGKNDNGDSRRGSNSEGRSSRAADAGRRSGAGAFPMVLASPRTLATEAGKGSQGEMCSGVGSAAPATAVFGPARDPNAASESSADAAEDHEEGFFCQVCEERVKSLSKEKHRTSTLHIFNQKHRPQDRKVQIHESNKGFQLLAGMGWKLDEGLGARKQGRVNPLQTTFKRDTTGLGAGEKLRPRVTHFPSHVPSQALNAPDGKSEAVRAHESLDRRRGRRRDRDGVRERRGRDAGGGSEAAHEPRGHGRIPADSSSGGKGSADSWGGFWGQRTQAERDRCSSEGASSRGSSSGRWIGGGRGGAMGGGGGSGEYGTGFFMSRKEREAEREREMRKARKARFELLSDVPEEYAALFMG